MKKYPPKRQVQVAYTNSNEVRLVDVPQHSADATDTSEPSKSEAALDTPITKPGSESNESIVQAVSEAVLEAEINQAPGLIGEEKNVSESAPATPDQKQPGASKSKVEIENLEQFIEYAYGRKGQRISLKSKTEKCIAQSPRLDDASISRLLLLAAGDTFLAVPRQLLLVSHSIEGYPSLRSALDSFVLTVMLRHPAFASSGIQASLQNLPEGLPTVEVLNKLTDYVPPEEEGKDPLKPAEIQILRSNAVHLFVTWLGTRSQLSMDELAGLLFKVLWAPSASDLLDDNAKLRALTEIEQFAGVGLACHRFRQQANESQAAQYLIQREITELREQLTQTEAQRLLLEEQRNTLAEELQTLRETSAAEMAEMKKQHDVVCTHLRHDQEQLRGRLIHRLEDGVELLEVGLSALRNKTPRIEVMVERAEHVVDALRSEMNNLRED